MQFYRLSLRTHLMMHPPLHMRAMPPMLSFHLNWLAASLISMKPWAYDTILDVHACSA